jgi:hypothetical protein
MAEQFGDHLHHGQVVIDQQNFSHRVEANSKAGYRARGNAANDSRVGWFSI